jgi:hypothetical protein
MSCLLKGGSGTVTAVCGGGVWHMVPSTTIMLQMSACCWFSPPVGFLSWVYGSMLLRP